MLSINYGAIKNERDSGTAKESDLFVHIGDSELRGNLPVEGPLNAKLYKEVEEKQKLLAKLKEKHEKVSQEKEEISQQLEAQKNQRNFIQSLRESNERQLEQEKHLIKIAEVEKAQLNKELSETQQKLQEKDERCKALTNIFESQKQLYENLCQSGEEQQQLCKNFNDRIAGTEKSCAEMRRALENDNKIAMELEAYLKKLTKQIFDKQRELEKFRLGELDETVKIESVKRAIRRREKEQRALKDKYMEMLTSIKEANAKTEAQAVEKEDQSARQRTRLAELKSKLARVDSEIADIDRKRNAAENEWNDLQDKLSKLEAQLTEMSAKEKIERARNKRYETKIEILKLEPAPPMYKAYGAAKSKGRPSSPKSEQKQKQSNVRSDLIEKRRKELEEVRTSSLQAKTTVKNLRKRLQELRELQHTYEKRLMDLDKNDGLNDCRQQQDSDSIDTGSSSTSTDRFAHLSNNQVSTKKKHSSDAGSSPNNDTEKAARDGLDKANAKRDKVVREANPKKKTTTSLLGLLPTISAKAQARFVRKLQFEVWSPYATVPKHALR